MRYGFLASLISVPLFAEPVRAGFILDDFDDPAKAVVQSLTDSLVTTENVGSLGATRGIGIAASRGDPVGSFDVALSSPSISTAVVTDLNPTSSRRTDVFIAWRYDVEVTDFSESGKNNAFFFNFRRLTAEMPPSRLLVLVNDGHEFYAHQNFSVPLSSEPFTMVVPFDAFTIRGGPSALPDYTTIQTVFIDIRPTLFLGGGADPLNLLMELDRIRVGAIPESDTGCLLSMAIVVFATLRTD